MKRSARPFLGITGTRALVLAAIIGASTAVTVTAGTWSVSPPDLPAPSDPVCSVGYHLVNGECILIPPITCPAGYHLEGDSCAPDPLPACPDGYMQWNGQCILVPQNPDPDPVPDPKPDDNPKPRPPAIPFSELHGVNFIDRMLDRNTGGRTTPVRSDYVEEFVAKAKESGFNVFRIPVRWEGYVDNEAVFLEELEYLVKTADKHDIYVWIVFFQYEASSHWPYKVSSYGGGFPEFVVSCYHPTKGYERDPEIRAFWDDYYQNKVRDSTNFCLPTLDVWSLQADFMEDMIDQVDKYDNVMGYELINEPHVWKDAHYDQLGELHTALAEELRNSTDKVLIFTRETAHGFTSDGSKYQRKANLEYKILPRDPARNVVYAPHTYGLSDIETQVTQWKNVQSAWALMGYDVKIAVGEWALQYPQSATLISQQNMDRFVSVWAREGWMHTYWAYGGFIYDKENVLIEYDGDPTAVGRFLEESIDSYYDG